MSKNVPNRAVACRAAPLPAYIYNIISANLIRKIFFFGAEAVPVEPAPGAAGCRSCGVGEHHADNDGGHKAYNYEYGGHPAPAGPALTNDLCGQNVKVKINNRIG